MFPRGLKYYPACIFDSIQVDTAVVPKNENESEFIMRTCGGHATGPNPKILTHSLHLDRYEEIVVLPRPSDPGANRGGLNGDPYVPHDGRLLSAVPSGRGREPRPLPSRGSGREGA